MTEINQDEMFTIVDRAKVMVCKTDKSFDVYQDNKLIKKFDYDEDGARRNALFAVSDFLSNACGGDLEDHTTRYIRIAIHGLPEDKAGIFRNRSNSCEFLRQVDLPEVSQGR